MWESADLFRAPIWLIASGVVALGSWRVSRRLFPCDPWPFRVGCAILLGWAIILGTAIVLGSTSSLTPWGYVWGVGAASLGLLVWTIRGPSSNLSNPGLLIEDTPAEGARPATRGRWVWNLAWGMCAAFWIGHSITGGLFRFPHDWDTLMYHLPLVDHWLQARSLYAPDCLRWSEPGNNELLVLWLAAPFTGDFLYALNNLPATVLLAIASVEVGRCLGLTAAWRNLAGLAIVTNFVVAMQLTDAENDVAVAACFLATLACALRFSHGGRPADLALGVIALGLLAGIKFYALGYAGVAGLTAFGAVAHQRGWRTAARTSVAGLAGLFLFAGYWYLRNWVVGGSPLYPFGAPDQSGETALGYPDLWRTTFVGNGSPKLPVLLVRAVWEMSGPCCVAGLLGVPLTVGWLFLGGSRRSPRVALAGATLGAGVVWALTPFAVEDVPGTLNQMHWHYCPVRYGMCFLSLATIALALMFQDVASGLHRLGRKFDRTGAGGEIRGPWFGTAIRLSGCLPAILFAVGLVLQAGVVRSPRLHVGLPDALLVGGNVALFAVNLHWLSALRYRGVTVLLGLSLLVGATVGIGWLSAHWHRGFAAHYDSMLGQGVFQHLAETRPPGTALCVLDLRAYPFFGSARQFRVCQPHAVRSYPWWEDYIRNNGIDLLVARYDLNIDTRGWLGTRLWIVDRPHSYPRLRPTQGEWPYTVCEVRRGAGER